MLYKKEISDLNLINPFIRFAKSVVFKPIDEYTMAGDYHFYYILSKNASLDINGDVFEIKKGTVILMPPNLRYSFKTENEIETISINFDYTQNNNQKSEWIIPEREKEFNSCSVVEQIEFCEEYSILNKPLVIDNMHHIKSNLDTILQEFDYKKQFNNQISGGIFKAVLFNILREATQKGDKNESIDKILNFIHSHFSEDITNEELSKISGYHPYHLNRLMKQYTGTTIHQYIIDYRIETAKSMLRETDLPINLISLKCGYNNFSNFSYDFRRKTDLTPSLYRKQTQHLL